MPTMQKGKTARIITRSGKVYEGTCQLCDASVHVKTGNNDETQRTFDTVEVLPDEKINTKEDTKALGIMTGDIVAFDLRTTITQSGYIKSRFLDDKLSAAILLGYAAYLKEEHIVTERKLYQHFTVYEEVGHGGAASYSGRRNRSLVCGHGLRRRWTGM